MAIILNLETSSTVCSAALGKNGVCIALKEVSGGYTHAENLTVFIEEVIKQARIPFSSLDAVAVSSGPGSYTGLRIGVSAAKGLCYALEIPLLAVDTLKALAAGAMKKQYSENGFYCAMTDARRMEVYFALYDHELKTIQKPCPLVLNKHIPFPVPENSRIFFFGNGSGKFKSLEPDFRHAVFVESVMPSAEFMTGLSEKRYKEGKFENTAYFEPNYLKDFTGGGIAPG